MRGAGLLPGGVPEARAAPRRALCRRGTAFPRCPPRGAAGAVGRVPAGPPSAARVPDGEMNTPDARLRGARGAGVGCVSQGWDRSETLSESRVPDGDPPPTGDTWDKTGCQ